MKVTEAQTRETESVSRERAARERAAADRLNPRMTGADLIRECESALAAVLKRSGRKVSADERMTLVQTLACDTLTAQRERYGDEPLRRSHVGRNYLSALARGHLKQERGWRDTLDGYRVRSERERGLAPLFAGSVESAAQRESERGDGEPRGWLTVAIDRESERASETARRLPAVAPEHLRTLAETLCETLADECGASAAERPLIRAAVLSACGIPLIRQSESERCSVSALKRRSRDGNAILRERLTARECSTLVRIAASESADEHRLMRALATSLSVETERLARAALDATETVLCAEYRVSRRAQNAGSRVTASAEPLSRFTGQRYR